MDLQQQLKSLLHYDPATGIFRWRAANGGNMRSGDIAGTIGDRGYRRIDVLGKQYPAARLAWLYMVGAWPTYQVDHVNLVKDDNRWSNLREATPSQNKSNNALRADSSSGYKGVHKLNGKWIARCSVDGKRHYLGQFDSAEEASLAYQRFAKERHGEFFRPH